MFVSVIYSQRKSVMFVIVGSIRQEVVTVQLVKLWAQRKLAVHLVWTPTIHVETQKLYSSRLIARDSSSLQGHLRTGELCVLITDLCVFITINIYARYPSTDALKGELKSAIYSRLLTNSFNSIFNLSKARVIVQGMTLKCIPIFIVTGSFLYWCVLRPASQRFFIQLYLSTNFDHILFSNVSWH